MCIDLEGVMIFRTGEFNIFYRDKVKPHPAPFPPHTVSFTFRRNSLFHIADFLRDCLQAGPTRQSFAHSR